MRLFVVLLLIFFFFLDGYGSELDTQRLIKKLRKESNVNIGGYLSLQDDESGCFRDIDYEDKTYSHWQPSSHLDRIQQYTEAYINEKSRYYQSDLVFTKITEGVLFWIHAKPYSPNWWYNQIKSPTQIGQILINMRFGKMRLDRHIEDSCISIMKSCVTDPYQYVGANRTDIATHWIFRACLVNDDSLMQSAVDLIKGSVRYNRNEGIVFDKNYCQHGRQVYVGAYGSSFLQEVSRWAYLLKDTKYAFAGDDIRLLSDFARHTYFPTIRGNHVSYNVCGRSISRKGGTIISGSPYLIAKWLSNVDDNNRKEFMAIMNSLEKKEFKGYKQEASHNHFFYSDYTLHYCPKYAMDVKLSSKRTVKCESINNENTQNYFLSEGGTCIMVDGNEYDEVFPVWDWSRIPGVTAPYITDVPTIKGFTTSGSSDFAGGVSDSIHGVSAMIYVDDKYKVSAKKSWFFFDKEIVCIGTDINSDSQYPIETTINQCLDKTRCFVSTKNNRNYGEITQYADMHIKSPSWIMHNKVGYLFPLKSNLIISRGKRKGNWNRINKRYDEDEVEKDVFCLGISHGFKVHDSSYLYILLPGINSMQEIIDYSSNSNIAILKQSKTIHAVYDTQADILQVVFFEAGDISNNGMHLKVDIPCAMIIKGLFTGTKPTIHVSNIKQTKKKINVSLTYKERKKELIFNSSYNEILAGVTECRNVW